MEPAITSTRHPLVAAVRRLLASPAARREFGVCVLEGSHLITEAAAAGLPFVAVMHTEGFARSPAGARVLERAMAAPRTLASEVPLPPREAGSGWPVAVGDRALAAMSELSAPEGVLAIVRLPRGGPAPASPPFALALDGVQDPGNVGALARALCAFGGAGALLLVGPGSADPWSGKALRGSAGALLWVAVRATSDLPADLRAGDGARRWWALQPRGGTPLPAADLTPPCGFVVGSEGRGCSAAVSAACRGLTLPTTGAVESLGAGQAGAIALFAAASRHWPAGPPLAGG